MGSLISLLYLENQHHENNSNTIAHICVLFPLTSNDYDESFFFFQIYKFGKSSPVEEF